MRIRIRALVLLVFVLLAGSWTQALSKGAPAKGGEREAREILLAMMKPGADKAQLSRALQPQGADYKAVFTGEMAQKAEAMYRPAWDSGKLVIEGRPEQTELKLWAATTEDLQTGTGNAREFPGGYKKVAPFLNKGLVFYRFKFVEPGKDLGISFDGLVFVNGRFVIFPKPWRMLGP